MEWKLLKFLFVFHMTQTGTIKFTAVKLVCRSLQITRAIGNKRDECGDIFLQLEWESNYRKVVGVKE